MDYELGDLTVYFVGRKAVYDFKYSPIEEYDKETGEIIK